MERQKETKLFELIIEVLRKKLKVGQRKVKIVRVVRF